MDLCKVVMSGKATHERQLWGDSLLNLFSNCEWAWQTHQACFFTMPGVYVTVVLLGLLSMFGKSGGLSLLEFQSSRAPLLGRPAEGCHVMTWSKLSPELVREPIIKRWPPICV